MKFYFAFAGWLIGLGVFMGINLQGYPRNLVPIGGIGMALIFAWAGLCIAQGLQSTPTQRED